MGNSNQHAHKSREDVINKYLKPVEKDLDSIDYAELMQKIEQRVIDGRTDLNFLSTNLRTHMHRNIREEVCRRLEKHFIVNNLLKDGYDVQCSSNGLETGFTFETTWKIKRWFSGVYIT